MPLRTRIAIAFFALAAMYSCGGWAGEIAAVVSSKTPVPALTSAQLADIFLGRTNRFPDGTPAMPCDLAEGSALRDEFYSRVVGKSAAQVKAYWSKIIFTGRGRPPREVTTSAEAKKLVAENPGVICYIDRALVDATVHVVLAIEEQR